VVFDSFGKTISSGFPLVVITIPPPEDPGPEVEDQSTGIETLIIWSVKFAMFL
jgi:hypothetical protein